MASGYEALPQSGNRYIIGTDTGGTFTDIVVLNESGEMWIDKAPSTPGDFSQGVLNAVKHVAENIGVTSDELLRNTLVFKHGSTVGTNALITRDGAKVGLVTTKGFEDSTLIMRAIGRVAGLGEEEIKHQAVCTKPEPIVPKKYIWGVTERVDFRGQVVVSLNLEETREAIRYLVDEAGVDAIAVNLLFGYVNPVHEREIKRLFQDMYPDSDVTVSLASDICKTIREYARSNTVIINEFLNKTVHEYISKLDRQLREENLSGPLLVMQSNGGAVLPSEVIPVGTVNSGPAGGLIAGKFMAELLGHENVITTDMGGTSFDVGLILSGRWEIEPAPVVERFHVSWPMLSVNSIGAGGGTIARVDPTTRQLIVGPKSAGADPGPVCYDRGGRSVTVTDADLVLGFLDPTYFLGGRMVLNKSKAQAAIEEQIARPLGIDVVEAAAGLYNVVNSHMADLVRRKVVTTGHIPEECVIYAFGGAGPVHAAGYSAELGCEGVYVFPTSSVFSAFGIAGAEVVASYSESFRRRLPCDPVEINQQLYEIERQLKDRLLRQGVNEESIIIRRTFYMRYVKQLAEIAVDVPAGVYGNDDILRIMEAFELKYEDIYGVGAAYRQAGIELISFMVNASATLAQPHIVPDARWAGPDASGAIKGERAIFFPEAGAWVHTPIFDFHRLLPGNQLEGPAIIETPVTTVVIPPKATCSMDQFNTFKINVKNLESK